MGFLSFFKWAFYFHLLWKVFSHVFCRNVLVFESYQAKMLGFFPSHWPDMFLLKNIGTFVARPDAKQKGKGTLSSRKSIGLYAMYCWGVFSCLVMTSCLILQVMVLEA